MRSNLLLGRIQKFVEIDDGNPLRFVLRVNVGEDFLIHASLYDLHGMNEGVKEVVV